ncbi:DUF4865 family protein [Acidovorax sp. Root217]|uniref:DUF4865 family protein n=1 Tax=Acidovorax sp. Root217 TaxID=1736492 RepID=UPI00070F98D4|nr:DUF4865 family protein [Acidovorax sp. Root217]
MLAMQYGFDLPDDFDMAALRRRIPEIGSRFDALPGLHLKAFLLADRTATAPNRYTPFYLWDDPAGAAGFVTSPDFAAVQAKYGHPVVHGWTPIAHLQGPAAGQVPGFATQHFAQLPDTTDLVQRADDERATAAALAGTPGVHSVFTGLDAQGWQVNRTVLWSGQPPADAEGRVFELLYLSAPGGVRSSGAVAKA